MGGQSRHVTSLTSWEKWTCHALPRDGRERGMNIRWYLNHCHAGADGITIFKPNSTKITATPRKNSRKVLQRIPLSYLAFPSSSSDSNGSGRSSRSSRSNSPPRWQGWWSSDWWQDQSFSSWQGWNSSCNLTWPIFSPVQQSVRGNSMQLHLVENFTQFFQFFMGFRPQPVATSLRPTEGL